MKLKNSVAFFSFVIVLATSESVEERSTQKLRRRTADRATTYDCNGVGCPFDVVDFVCAKGTITFQNECLAFCQGFDESSIEEGPCVGAEEEAGVLGGAQEEAATLQSTTESETVKIMSITPNVISRYANEGFVCVGTCGFGGVPEVLEPVENLVLNERGLPPKKKRKKRMIGTVEAFRVSYDGYAYFSSFNINNDANENETEEQNRHEHKGNGKDNGGRRVSVIGGVDTRTSISNTDMSPYRYIGEVDYNIGREGGCSGTIVDKNSVLTAAHCIYSRSQQTFLPVKSFAPGRRKKGKLMNSGYVWKAKDATLYQTWLDSGDSNYDISILRTQSNRLGSIGDVIGTLQLKPYDCDIDKNSRIIGYPGDKVGFLDGMQFTSGLCDGWSHRCNDFRISHQCDTYGGNSGSPMLDADQKIFGVHTHGSGGGDWNSGVAINAEHLKKLDKWMQ